MKWDVAEGRASMVGFGSYATTLDALEQALKPGRYVYGDRITVADVYLAVSLGGGLLFDTIEMRPGFEAYVQRVNQRPAAQGANRINEARLLSGKT